MNQVVYYKPERDDKFILKCIENETLQAPLNVYGTPDISDVVKQDAWNICLTAVIHKKPVGFVRVRCEAKTARAYIVDIFVDPDCRRKGIGKMLIEQAELKAITSWNVGSIYALTIENEPMEKLLTAFGYKNRGTYEKFIYRLNKFYDQSLFIKQIK